MSTTIEISPDRLAQITTLAYGSHTAGSNEMCIMEAEAFIAGEPWSDTPDCVCPVLGAFMRSWNDSLNQKDRDRLILPFKGRFVGTRSTAEVERRRSLMAADWLVRTHTPAWLRLAGLTKQADALADLPEITSMAQVPSIRGPIEAARDDAAAAGDAARAAARAAAWDVAGAAWAAAGDAAWAAAGDAARAAAGDAARAAAGAAAWDVAWAAARAAAGDAARAAAGDAAWAAAGDAAWDVAWAAARAAAGDAARAALRPTLEELQTYTVALIERMLAA